VAFFHASTNFIGTVTNVPFNFIWNNVGVGNYVLTAVANNGGMFATSAPVNITVIDPQAAPLFSLGASSHSVAENVSGSVVQVTVLKSANSAAGSVVIQTHDGLATAVSDGSGDYVAV